MPSWTDRSDVAVETWTDAARDLRHLLRFRGRTVRRRGVAALALLVVGGLTLLFATAPAHFDQIQDESLIGVATGLVDLLRGNVGLAFAACLAVAVASSLGTGGGRELLARGEAAIHPIGPRTEHLGALALAPVNLAWLVQLWGLMTTVALVAPAGRLLGAQLVVVAWVLLATAAAQVVGWSVEGVRRLPHGVWIVRVGLGLIALVLGGLQVSGLLVDLVRALPTTWLADTAMTGRWPLAVAVCLAVTVALAWLGAASARWALGMPPREELKVASGVHEARPVPVRRWLSPEVALLVRMDRDSVWRSLGMRRGLIVLGVGPGLIALVVPMEWSTIIMLPGLAVSGALLLFGVNTWCLDGRGAVWRESLPVAALDVWRARVLVMAECLLVVSGITVLVAALRAGPPALGMGLAVLACWVVVVVQVLAVGLSWSIRSPYAVDLSSPRATPAPHGAMAGYAGRLSLVTTMTSLLFSALAALGLWWPPLAVAPVFLGWSLWRLARARRRWLTPPDRARVVLTVAVA